MPFDIKCGLCFATRDNLAPRFFLYNSYISSLPTLVKAKQSLMSVCMIETTTITTALLHLNHGMSQVLKWEGRNMASKYVKYCLGTLTTLYKNVTMKFGLDKCIIQNSFNQSCVSAILSQNLRILLKIFNLTLKCKISWEQIKILVLLFGRQDVTLALA